ncbi:MAG: ABC transporter substrate-binding protein, partial [Candidatus Thermoplasmatota archaeon]
MEDPKSTHGGRWLITASVALLLLVATFLGTLPTKTSADSTSLGGKYGGELRVALRNEPLEINPLMASTIEERQVVDLIYDSLARVDPNTLELIPWIARSWDVSVEDWMNVTVYVRDDVVWHSGATLSLQDIEYTYKIDGYAPAYITDITLNESANSITFHIEEPNGTFFTDGLLLKLVPEGFSNSSAPNGCGPYLLGEQVDGDHFTLEVFEDYFKGRTYLDSITFTYYANETIAIREIINGTLDTIGWNLNPLAATQGVVVQGSNTSLQKDNATAEVRPPSLKMLYLGFNCKDGAPLSTIALRKAIAHAVDKVPLSEYPQQIGNARVANSIVPPEYMGWYNTSIPLYDFDQDEANSILDAARIIDYDGDGYRNLSDGTPFHLRFLVPIEDEDLANYSDFHYTMAEQNIRNALDVIGLNVTIIADSAENRSAMIASDDYDIFMEFGEPLSPSPASLVPLFHSDGNVFNFDGMLRVENATALVNNVTNTAQLPHTHVSSEEITAWRNGVLWGTAVNQTIMTYTGTDYALLGNVSISWANASFWRI